MAGQELVLPVQPMVRILVVPHPIPKAPAPSVALSSMELSVLTDENALAVPDILSSLQKKSLHISTPCRQM
jgi:hypothetical protein